MKNTKEHNTTSFKQYLLSEKHYYKIGGDSYDGGSVLRVYAHGKKVHDDIRYGDHDFEHKGKKFNHIHKLLGHLADKHKVPGGHKGFKRYEMK